MVLDLEIRWALEESEGISVADALTSAVQSRSRQRNNRAKPDDMTAVEVGVA